MLTYGVQEWQEARKEKLLLRTQRLREEEEAQLAAARVRAFAFEFAPRKVLSSVRALVCLCLEVRAA